MTEVARLWRCDQCGISYADWHHAGHIKSEKHTKTVEARSLETELDIWLDVRRRKRNDEGKTVNTICSGKHLRIASLIFLRINLPQFVSGYPCPTFEFFPSGVITSSAQKILESENGEDVHSVRVNRHLYDILTHLIEEEAKLFGQMIELINKNWFLDRISKNLYFNSEVRISTSLLETDSYRKLTHQLVKRRARRQNTTMWNYDNLRLELHEDTMTLYHVVRHDSPVSPGYVFEDENKERFEALIFPWLQKRNDRDEYHMDFYDVNKFVGEAQDFISLTYLHASPTVTQPAESTRTEVYWEKRKKK